MPVSYLKLYVKRCLMFSSQQILLRLAGLYHPTNSQVVYLPLWPV